MIPEEHLPAVDDVCDRVIHVAHHTCATPAELTAWVRERLRTRYDYPEVE